VALNYGNANQHPQGQFIWFGIFWTICSIPVPDEVLGTDNCTVQSSYRQKGYQYRLLFTTYLHFFNRRRTYKVAVPASHYFIKKKGEYGTRIKFIKKNSTWIKSHSAGRALLRFFRFSKCFDLWRGVPFMCRNFVTRPNLIKPNMNKAGKPSFVYGFDFQISKFSKSSFFRCQIRIRTDCVPVIHKCTLCCKLPV
jgi:hypothetical protein